VRAGQSVALGRALIRQQSSCTVAAWRTLSRGRSAQSQAFSPNHGAAGDDGPATLFGWCATKNAGSAGELAVPPVAPELEGVRHLFVGLPRPW